MLKGILLHPKSINTSINNIIGTLMHLKMQGVQILTTQFISSDSYPKLVLVDFKGPLIGSLFKKTCRFLNNRKPKIEAPVYIVSRLT